MFKLVHISDVHLGPLPAVSVRELLSKRITGYVNWQRNRKKHLFGNTLTQLLEHIGTQSPDHLAITGDLVNLATKTEIENAALWLESLGNPQNISVVPGNHDAYVPGALGKSLTAWHPYVIGDEAPVARRPSFPFLRVRGNIALIGISTAHATPPFSANGSLGPRQGERVARMLEQTGRQGLFRIIMIHHPPVRGAASNYKRMTGIGRFGKILAEHGAELVLHGHTHLNTVYRLEGKTGPVPVVGIASASQGTGGRKPPAAYNLFSIAGTAGDWEIRRERYCLNAASDGFELSHTDEF